MKLFIYLETFVWLFDEVQIYPTTYCHEHCEEINLKKMDYLRSDWFAGNGISSLSFSRAGEKEAV